MSHTRSVRNLAGVVVSGSLALALLNNSAEAKSPSALSERFTAVGSSHIGSIDADLPIAKTTLSATLATKNLKIIGGTLPIAPQTVSFTAWGVIPVRAVTTLIQASPITGALRVQKKGNVLNSKVSYTIKLSDVQAQLLGQWVPLDVGDDCQTINPAAIAVASPAGHYFDIVKGGELRGSYTIGKFENCAPLQLPDPTGLGSLTVNALVPGSNNTVALRLSHGRLVGAK